MIRFDAPLAFLLLALVPVVIFFSLKKSGRAGVLFSSTRNAGRVQKSLRQQLMGLPLILRVLGLVFLVAAIARPQEGKEVVKDVSQGIAIEMVVDRSGSMQAEKMVNGKNMNRLDIVKEVFAEFVTGKEGALPGRPNDLIGLITFARFPDTRCPLTLSHQALLRFIESTKLVQLRSEDGTSIGDALALAAARLKTAEETFLKADEKQNYEIKSKIIILLTDGEDTGVGKRNPLEGARLAKEWGIKVYTIGLSGNDWFVTIDDPLFGRRKEPVQSRIDRVTLEKIASETGGLFRTAEDMGSLIDVYKEIDKMEKSEIQVERYLDYRELFIFPLVLALILFAAEAILGFTLLRRIP